MPASSKTVFECIECGGEYLRWQGQCDQCQAWNTLEILHTVKATKKGGAIDTVVSALADVTEPETERLDSGFAEVDRVLGGGWVHGSVNLICGEPGVGKSTLVLQSLLECTRLQKKTLYITAEESTLQVKHRAKRLTGEISSNVFICATTEMDTIIEIIQKERPDLVVLDSIQMVISHKLTSMPGSLNQVRLCASMFIKIVKNIGAIGILVGHITKDGQLAGPKMLEHMVDVILFFEGERSGSVRMLRTLKNRFGTTNETGLFKMKSEGLTELTNSQYLISDMEKPPLPGSVITSILSGTRGMLVELQALAVQGGYQHVKRTFVGVDSHRAHLMIAIIDKYFNLKLSTKDVFISLVGGIKTMLPDIDLAICFSVWSSYYLRAMPKSVAILGEVGLTGEVLPIAHLDRYLSSMELLGIQSCILPKANQQDWQKKRKIQPVFIENLMEAYQIFNTITEKVSVPAENIGVSLT
jgi:DNA repair protein RadA/Sms